MAVHKTIARVIALFDGQMNCGLLVQHDIRRLRVVENSVPVRGRLERIMVNHLKNEPPLAPQCATVLLKEDLQAGLLDL